MNQIKFVVAPDGEVSTQVESEAVACKESSRSEIHTGPGFNQYSTEARNLSADDSPSGPAHFVLAGGLCRRVYNCSESSGGI